MKPDVKSYLVIIALMVILTAVLPIEGPYVLNDSYAYAKNVESFLNGIFRFWDITWPVDLFPVAVATLASKIFGYSLGLLRFTTVFLGTIGVLAFYCFLRYLKIPERKALLGTLMLIFNPLYIYLTFSFMSEISFLTPAIISVLLYQRGINEKDERYLFLGSIFCSLAFLSRQIGLFIAPVTILFLFWKQGKDFNIKNLFLILFLPTLTFLWYHFIFPSPAGYQYFNLSKGLMFLAQPKEALTTIAIRILESIYYLGIFAAPMIIGAAVSRAKNLKSKKGLIIFISTFLALGLLSGALWTREKRLMFYIPNIITYAGYIPSELGGGESIKQTIFVDVPIRVKVAITFGSILLSATGISILAMYRRKGVNIPILTLFSLAATFILFFFRSFFDRYLLLLVPLLIIKLLEHISTRKAFTTAFISLAIYGLITTTYEYDYLALNKKIGELVQKYGTKKTFSTFSLNNYYHLERSLGMTPEEIIDQRKWQLQKEEVDYLISYEPSEKWETVEETYYQTPLGKNLKIPLYVLSLKNKKLP